MPLLAGCGGGGGSSSVLTGDAGFRASTVAEVKSLGAGVAYPFAALKLAAPSGSPLHGATATATSVAHALSTLKGRAASRVAGLTLVPFLNLYTDGGAFSGHVYTVSYFADAAGTQAAGTMKITLPANISDADNPLSFASYPVTVPIDVDLTGGTLPCKGTVLLKFTGQSGANSLTGSLTLTKDNVTFALNLGLSDSFDVSGAITINENGSTIQITNVHGNLSSDLQCDVAVTPNGGIGTGTLNLNTGVMTVNLTTGTAASDSSGSLALHYADGKQETVANALAASLTGSGSGGTGTGGGTGTASYNAPLLFTSDQRTIVMLNNSGQSIGLVKGDSSSSFWSSPTSAPQALKLSAGDAGIIATSLNDSGQIVGVGFPNLADNNRHPLYWASASAAPQSLAAPTDLGYVSATSINNRGEIVGSTGGPVNNGVGSALYWSSPAAQPQVLAPLSGGTTASAVAIFPDGQILGKDNDVNGGWVVWTSPTATPHLLAALPDGRAAMPVAIGPNGLIVGGTDGSDFRQHPVTWANPTTPAQQLPGIPNSDTNQGIANSINSSSVIVGTLHSQSGADTLGGAALWKDGKLQFLNSLIPAGNTWSLQEAVQITDSGLILGKATHYNTTTQHYDTAQFILTPK